MGNSTTRHAVESAFANKLIESIGQHRMRETHSNYAYTVADNLLPTVCESDFLDELLAGDGNELEDTPARPAKFCAAHSSSALAVNVFGIFKRHLEWLRLFGHSGFTECRFEQKLRTGISTPNIDFSCMSSDACIFVESKCTEQLSEKKAVFSPRYREVVERLAEPAWLDVYDSLMKNPTEFKHLDAAQLVKHYLGIRHSFRDEPRELILGYIYWEPRSAEQYKECLFHREEIQRFSNMVQTSAIQYRPASYQELFAQWGSVLGLEEHIKSLIDRYDFEV